MTALPSVPASPGRPSSSLHFVVGEMSGKIDQIMASILPQLQELKANDLAIEARLTVLERFQWIVLGVISAGGALWAVVQQAPTIIALIKVAAQ